MRDWRFHAPRHAVVQALELQPWEWFNLALLQQKATGPLRTLVAMILFMAMVCVRFKHLQHSSVAGVDAGFVWCICTKASGEFKEHVRRSRTSYRD